MLQFEGVLEGVTEHVPYKKAVLTYRLIRKAREAGFLDKMSFGSFTDNLNSSRCQTLENEDAPHTDDRKRVHTLANVFELLEALYLSVLIPRPAPRKRGRSFFYFPIRFNID